MVIIIGNQKGGTGKSTLTLLLANYLSEERKCSVSVIDMGYQQSLQQQFQKSKMLENLEPYQVISITAEHFSLTLEMLLGEGSQFILVDLPGELNDDDLLEVFLAADVAVCPFNYDELCFEPTIFFSFLLKMINPEIEMAYVPNRIKPYCNERIRGEVNDQLSSLGTVTSSIAERSDFRYLTPAYTPPALASLTGAAFGELWESCLRQESSALKP